MDWVKFLCILLGPGFWTLVVVLSAFARFRMSHLLRLRSVLPTPAPSLAIVVPARNEASGIRACIERLRSQDYPDAHIIAIDDRSTDDTRSILTAEASPGVTIVPVDELPEGWLGKNHALHVGTRGLDAQWLLLVDSDVVLEPHAARTMVAACVDRKWDALSIFPRLNAPTYWERTLLPILATLWSGLFLVSLTNDDSKPRHAFANGQVFLIRRSFYKRVGGHESVKDQIVEDVMLMRRLKQAGARTRLMFGQSLGMTRMHTNLTQMFNGWARILAGTSRRNPVPTLAGLVLVGGTCAALVASGLMILSPGWGWIAPLHASLMFGFFVWCYRSAGVNPGVVLALPVSMAVVLAILANALRVCFTGRVDWRGNAVRVSRG
jgi:cellulose synthase/poly-beta-1,6-N-acetylglucosamine synthase-like glycosyltransferase